MNRGRENDVRWNLPWGFFLISRGLFNMTAVINKHSKLGVGVIDDDASYFNIWWNCILQVVKKELESIDEVWKQPRFDSLPHVVSVLTSRNPETALEKLREQRDAIEELVDDVVRIYHNGFNKATHNYSQVWTAEFLHIFILLSATQVCRPNDRGLTSGQIPPWSLHGFNAILYLSATL